MTRGLGTTSPKHENQERARHQRARFALAAVPLLFALLWVASQIKVPAYTNVELVDPGSGRVIYAGVLTDGEVVTLTWTNSIFRQEFEEVFVALDGELILTEITVTDPNDPYMMEVTPEEVNDYYHVGGAFHAKGLEKPFSDVMYRISEIGDPHLAVNDQVIAFKEEVGFGGRVHLMTRQPTLLERVREH